MNDGSPACFAGLLLACFAAIAATGCQPGDPNRPPGQNIIAVQQGKNVYDAQCAQCHEASDLHLLKDPPRLDGLFRKPQLPSGAPATDQEVRDAILHGRGIMPPFELTVNGDDLDALMQYLHTR